MPQRPRDPSWTAISVKPQSIAHGLYAPALPPSLPIFVMLPPFSDFLSSPPEHKPNTCELHLAVTGSAMTTSWPCPPTAVFDLLLLLILLGYLHSGLAAGMAIGIVGDAGVRAVGQQERLFVGMILILIFAEALGLYGMIVALILSQSSYSCAE